MAGRIIRIADRNQLGILCYRSTKLFNIKAPIQVVFEGKSLTFNPKFLADPQICK